MFSALMGPGTVFKRSLIFLWAAWFFLIAVSNVTAALSEAGALQESWNVLPADYSTLVSDITGGYGSAWLQGLLLALLIVAEVAVFGLFLWAFVAFKSTFRAVILPVSVAGAIGLALLGAFLFVDEGVHLRAFIALVISLLGIHLAPEPSPAR